MRTKADFRAVREFIGLSQQDIANDLGISAITPRRWESPSSNEPPEFAWEYLEDQLKRFYEIASYAIMQVTEAEHKPETVVFTLYRSQEQYDEFGRDPGSYGFVNGCARFAGGVLRMRGFDVEYRYPDEGAIRTPGSRY